MKPKQIFELFFNESKYKITENFNEVTITAEGQNIQIPNKDIIMSYFKTINDRDEIILDVIIKESDSVCPITKDDLQEDLEELKHAVSIGEEKDLYELKMSILKNRREKTISVYFFDVFIQTIKNMKFKDLLINFSEILNNDNYLLLETQNDNSISFYTQSLYFNTLPSPKEINRSNIIEKRNEVSNFINSSEFCLIPDDFKLVKKSENEDINGFFNKLSAFLSLLFISDISTLIEDNIIEIKINGYTLVMDRLDFSSTELDYSELYNIYEWIYTGGNISDKIGLARNIISINYRANETHLVKPNTFNSIKSGFSIYLKDNVKQYIEVTNKMGEYLLDLSFKVSDVIKTFGGSFKNNNFIVVSFFLSVIVFNSLSSGNFNDIFTKDIIAISVVILIISLLYLIASIYVVIEELNKFKNDFNRFKTIYKDLLIPEDIDKIFDKSFLEDNSQYVINKIVAYSLVWALEIMLLGILISYFYSCM